MAAKSFIEILEQEIRKDLREEIENQVRKEMQAGKRQTPHVSESWETWLVSNVEKAFFSRSQEARRVYSGATKTPRSPKESKSKVDPIDAQSDIQSDEHLEVRRSASHFEEACALEILRRNSGVVIPDAFTRAELKGAWRKAALKSHPDRFSQADQGAQAHAAALFRELAHAYELLENLFSQEIQEAA
jgi:hypothetical protein